MWITLLLLCVVFFWLGVVLADLRLFGEHYKSFIFFDEDLLEKDLSKSFTGITDVKGFTYDTEVLTSRGWMLFSDLYDVLLEEFVLWERFSKAYSSHLELRVVDEFDMSGFVFDPILVASVSPYVFDEDLKERVGDSGRVVFVQPTGFYHWRYNRLITSVKLRGISLRMSQYADVVGRKRFRDDYGFVDVNSVYGNRYGEYYYLLLNKFTHNIGDAFNPKLFGEKLDGFVPDGLVGTDIYVKGRGAEVYPSEYVTRYNGYSGDLYNVTVLPYKSLIVRKERDKLVSGADSVRAFAGKPTVVGDASNKHVYSGVGYRRRVDGDVVKGFREVG